MTRSQTMFGLLVALVSGTALASPGGVNTIGPQGCNQCHTGGTAPTVVVNGPSTLASGEGAVFELTLTTPNGTFGGFHLVADKAGTFSMPGAGVKVVNTGSTAVHNAPKAESAADNLVHFTATWTPSAATTGNVTLTGWGNSVNGANGSDGDRAASDTFTFCVRQSATAVCAGNKCGMVSDGCGGMVTCAGMCTGRQTCGGGGVQNVCGCAAGTIMTETCNGSDDDCDGLVDDGNLCTAGQTCTAGSCVGGPVPDAGTDAGVKQDAGTPGMDAGNTPADAGAKTDAGAQPVADAGGTVDAGNQPEPEPTGGCNAVNGPVMALLALAGLAVFMRRRKSTR